MSITDLTKIMIHYFGRMGREEVYMGGVNDRR